MTPATPRPRPPAQIAWITDHIPAEAALRLLEAFGGTRIYIPSAPNQGSPLTRAIGRDAAAALAAAHGGQERYIPIERNWQVACLRHQGLSYQAIAQRLKISASSVHGHLHGARLTNRRPEEAGAETGPEQPDLFG